MTYQLASSTSFGRTSRLRRRKTGKGLLLAAVLATFGLTPWSAPGWADQWFIQGRASVLGVYDDNIRLRPTNEEDALGVIIRPELDIHGRAENWDFVLTNFFALERYDDSSFDSENLGIDLESSYRTQLQVFGLDGLISRETTLSSEETDTGDFEDTGFKHTFELEPSWSYRLTPRQSVILGAGLEVVEYTGTDQFDDFQTYSADVGWGYQLTQRDEIRTSFVYSHNNSDDDENSKSDFFGVALGWGREVSERLNWFIRAGPRYFVTEQDRVVNGQTETDEDSSFGYFLNGLLAYDLSEVTRIRSEVRRVVEGTGAGGTVQRNELQVIATHRFLPRWVGSLRTRFQFNQDPNGDDDTRKRNFILVRPQISWEFARDWQVSAYYRFRTEDEEDSDRAYSNAVFVGLTYSTPEWTFAN